MGDQDRYRLVTRSDFDGLVCAVLLKEKDLIDDILFVHPKDVQDGKVDITDRDITANLPYVPQCHLALDHHASEAIRVEGTPDNLREPQTTWCWSQRRSPRLGWCTIILVERTHSRTCRSR